MTLVVFDWSTTLMNCVLVYTPPSIHISCPDFAVYTVLFWSPAIEHSKLQPLLMKPAALTNISHHTLITPIILNNTPILIHINGDNKSASNNQMRSVTNNKNQSFKLLLTFSAIEPAYHATLNPTCHFKNSICVIGLFSYMVY